MAIIDHLVNALKETTIARQIGIPHDEARLRYRLEKNTVRDWRAFESAIADYYQYHYTRCVCPGGRLPWSECAGLAKEVVERERRRTRQGDIVSAFNDARDGTHGGLKTILDIIAEGLKAESVERYTRDQFESRIPPNDFEAKVDIIRQFIERFGAQLSDSIQANRPERYAQDYQELVQSFVDGLQQTSSIFRRL
jgi:hypothetical protein